jgi:hypothetical protein
MKSARKFFSMGDTGKSKSGGPHRTSSVASTLDRLNTKILYEGWLNKRPSSSVGSWQMRYFILTPTTLYYMKKEGDTKAKGTIEVGSIMTVRESHIPSAPAYSFDIVTDTKLFVASADTERARESWINVLKTVSNCADVAAINSSIPESLDLSDTEIRGFESGWLMKLPKNGGKFQKRFIMLTEDALLYYKKDNDSEAAGKIEFNQILEVKTIQHTDEGQLKMDLDSDISGAASSSTSKSGSNVVLHIITVPRTYIFANCPPDADGPNDNPTIAQWKTRLSGLLLPGEGGEGVKMQPDHFAVCCTKCKQTFNAFRRKHVSKNSFPFS